MNNQFVGKSEYQPAPLLDNVPFTPQSMVMAMLEDLLNYISRKDLTLERYRMAQKVFKAVKVALTNPQTPRPSKEELQTALDVIAEIKKEHAQSQAEKDSIEREAAWKKQFLEWFLPD